MAAKVDEFKKKPFLKLLNNVKALLTRDSKNYNWRSHLSLIFYFCLSASLGSTFKQAMVSVVCANFKDHDQHSKNLVVNGLRYDGANEKLNVKNHLCKEFSLLLSVLTTVTLVSFVTAKFRHPWANYYMRMMLNSFFVKQNVCDIPVVNRCARHTSVLISSKLKHWLLISVVVCDVWGQ